MFLKVTRYSTAVLVLAFLSGLLALNYSAIAAVIIGAVLAWPSVRLVRSIIANWKRISLPVIVVLSILGCSLYAIYLLPQFLSPEPPPPLINEYQLTIDSPDWQAGIFSIAETVVIDPQWVEYHHEPEIPTSVVLPAREVTSTHIGLLAREVKIRPGQADASGNTAITLADGRILQGGICSDPCGNIEVKIHDAPAGSFLAAWNAGKIQREASAQAETDSWSGFSLDQGITFSFVPPPFSFMGPVIAPLAGVSALNPGVLGLLGLIGTLLLTPILKPLLLEAAEKSFGPRLDKRAGAKTQA